MPPIFCLNVQTDNYNGHPRHFADELFHSIWNPRAASVPSYQCWLHTKQNNMTAVILSVLNLKFKKMTIELIHSTYVHEFYVFDIFAVIH